MLLLPRGCFVSQLMGLLTERGPDNTPHTHTHTHTHTLSPPLYTPWGKGEGYNFSFFLEMILFSLTACLLPGLRTIGCKDLIFLFFFFFTREKGAFCRCWWLSGFSFNTWAVTGVSMHARVFLYPILTPWEGVPRHLLEKAKMQDDSRSCFVLHDFSRTKFRTWRVTFLIRSVTWG